MSKVSSRPRTPKPIDKAVKKSAEAISQQNSLLVVMRDDLQEMEEAATSTYVKSAYKAGGNFVEWMMNVEEPRRYGLLYKVIQSKFFESFLAVVILLNACNVCLATNAQIADIQNYDSEPSILDWIFLIIYTFEQILKFSVHRFYLFIGHDAALNVFDMILVLLALVDDVWPLLDNAPRDHSMNLQPLRILRLVRVLRVVRLLRLFSELRLMLKSVVGSVVSLFWSFAMLMFIFYLFGLVFVQDMTLFLLSQGDEVKPLQEEEIYRLFGSVQGAMLTLFRSIFQGEDWNVCYQVLVQTSPMSAGLFLIFIGFSQISIINVVQAIFIQRTQALAKPDPHIQAMQENIERRRHAAQISRVFHRMDTDGSGFISKDELQKALASDHIKALFLVLGLDLYDTEEFIDMLQRQQGSSDIEIEAFVEGCMRMKGTASGVAQQVHLMETRTIQQQQAENNYTIKHQLFELLQRLDEVKEGLRTSQQQPKPGMSRPNMSRSFNT